MSNLGRQHLLIAALAIAGVGLFVHRALAQTPIVTTGETFKEIVTILTPQDGIHSDDPALTVYTVPAKRTLVITSVVITNDQDNYTDVILRENSARRTALVRVPQNQSFAATFPSGLEFSPEAEVRIENDGGPGGTLAGDVHVTLNGYLKKTL
jgi:hypothetical protein